MYQPYLNENFKKAADAHQIGADLMRQWISNYFGAVTAAHELFMNTPNIALGWNTPASLLDDEKGILRVKMMMRGGFDL